MSDFNRKVDETVRKADQRLQDAGARLNEKVASASERLEEETADLIAYLNNEVVPAVREHSTKALRVAAEKLASLADYLEQQKSGR
jgi:phytoene dehydrogenase-like protein